MLHVHIINTNTSERRDPITGETFRAGDRVVCCAGCGSAFREDSWHYLGGEHCQQRDTLKNVPDENAHLTLAWKKLDGKLCRTASTIQGTELFSTAMLSAVFLGITSAVFSVNYLSPLATALAFLIYTARRRGKISHITVFKNGLRAHRFFQKNKDHRLHEIEKIHVYQVREKVWIGHTLEITIQFKGKAEETFLFGSNNERSFHFFKALCYLSAQTQVTFDLPSGGALYKIAQSLREKHRLGGRFLVSDGEKPLKQAFPEAVEKKA